MLSSLESRRNKALGCVAEYRASLAHQLRESADRIIDGAIAQAELELARVRRAKVALIERASAFGELDPPQLTVAQLIRIANAFDRGELTIVPKAIDASATMPLQEPERSAEAVRRVLPELRKLDRYERRAAARRDRAVLHLRDRMLIREQSKVVTSAKRTQFY
jgi:hypothetical protein